MCLVKIIYFARMSSFRDIARDLKQGKVDVTQIGILYKRKDELLNLAIELKVPKTIFNPASDSHKSLKHKSLLKIISDYVSKSFPIAPKRSASEPSNRSNKRQATSRLSPLLPLSDDESEEEVAIVSGASLFNSINQSPPRSAASKSQFAIDSKSRLMFNRSATLIENELKTNQHPSQNFTGLTRVTGRSLVLGHTVFLLAEGNIVFYQVVSLSLQKLTLGLKSFGYGTVYSESHNLDYDAIFYVASKSTQHYFLNVVKAMGITHNFIDFVPYSSFNDSTSARESTNHTGSPDVFKVMNALNESISDFSSKSKNTFKDRVSAEAARKVSADPEKARKTGAATVHNRMYFLSVSGTWMILYRPAGVHTADLQHIAENADHLGIDNFASLSDIFNVTKAEVTSRNMISSASKPDDYQFEEDILGNHPDRFRNALVLWVMTLDGIYIFVVEVQVVLVSMIDRTMDFLRGFDEGPRKAVTGNICRVVAGIVMRAVNDALLRLSSPDSSLESFIAEVALIPDMSQNSPNYRQVFALSVTDGSSAVSPVKKDNKRHPSENATAKKSYKEKKLRKARVAEKADKDATQAIIDKIVPPKSGVSNVSSKYSPPCFFYLSNAGCKFDKDECNREHRPMNDTPEDESRYVGFFKTHPALKYVKK